MILHRCDAYVVVDKLAGLMTHRSELAPDDDVMMTRVRDALGAWVFPVHRLDRQTSGAMVFALTEDAARALRAAFDDGLVAKTYVAIVRGTFPPSVEVDYAIPKREGGDRVPAQTSFARLETGNVPGHEGATWSLVEARPKTGRYHQVRRHAAHLRHPLALDSNYGTGWFNRAVRAHGLARLALHAASIGLPAIGAEPARVVTAAMPADLVGTLERLRA